MPNITMGSCLSWCILGLQHRLCSHLSLVLICSPVVEDWTSAANSINGWLKYFLWTEAAQVIQAYGTPCCRYSLAFMSGHFTWALSLMVLFSGRGYWQELVESLIWVHCQLQVVPSIQPRALSITMDRATGIIHFLGGGIGVS